MMRNLRLKRAAWCLWLSLVMTGCGSSTSNDETSPQDRTDTESSTADPSPQATDVDDIPNGAETAEIVIAGGCFWCLEVALEQLQGVTDVSSGYAGGSEQTAIYRTVSSGRTKHAEAVSVTYDPQVISLETLLRVFFLAGHDPTQVDQQYPDVGKQYRSAVFYQSEAERAAVAAVIDDLNQSGKFSKPIATTLEPLDRFYMAEDYHQDYVKHNPDDGYVRAHSLPRREKVRKMFPELIAR